MSIIYKQNWNSLNYKLVKKSTQLFWSKRSNIVFYQQLFQIQENLLNGLSKSRSNHVVLSTQTIVPLLSNTTFSHLVEMEFIWLSMKKVILEMPILLKQYKLLKKSWIWPKLLKIRKIRKNNKNLQCNRKWRNSFH